MPSHLRWSTKTDSSKMLKIGLHDGGASLPFNLGCRTDAMIVAGGSTISEEGSVVATVELKKAVVKQSLRQTKATFICASLKSQLPVISCVTDMRGAAVAYYTCGQRRAGDNFVVCIERFFPSADSMMDWLRTALSSDSVPADVLHLRGDEVNLPGDISIFFCIDPMHTNLLIPICTCIPSASYQASYQIPSVCVCQ